MPLETILHVAFSRWPVERCIEDEKSELGLSHFECRKYAAVLRHMRITQLSHLFLARQTQRLAEKNPLVTICQVRDAANALIDALPLGEEDQKLRLAKAARILRDRQKKQRGIARVSRQGTSTAVTGDRHPGRATPLLHPAAEWVAL